MRIKKIYDNKIHDNILIMGTGPSVFYNMDKVMAYCKKYNPTIVGVNGVVHGLLSIQGNKYKEVDPSGKSVSIDCIDIENVFPHILFSFLLRKDKNTVSGERIKKDIKRNSENCDLFKAFILHHKKEIIKRNIALLCPDRRACEIAKKPKHAYGFKKYGIVSWKYYRSFRFCLLPRGYSGKRDPYKLRKLEKVKNIYSNRIKFKINHGGEFLLAWSLAQKPKKIAIVGMCDFPNKTIDKVRRGWFWLDRVREMPPRMSRNQSKIIEFIKSYYGSNFHDLNFSPV